MASAAVSAPQASCRDGDFYAAVLALFQPLSGVELSAANADDVRLDLCRKARLLLASSEDDSSRGGEAPSSGRPQGGADDALKHVLRVLSAACAQPPASVEDDPAAAEPASAELAPPVGAPDGEADGGAEALPRRRERQPSTQALVRGEAPAGEEPAACSDPYQCEPATGEVGSVAEAQAQEDREDAAARGPGMERQRQAVPALGREPEPCTEPTAAADAAGALRPDLAPEPGDELEAVLDGSGRARVEAGGGTDADLQAGDGRPGGQPLPSTEPRPRQSRREQEGEEREKEPLPGDDAARASGGEGRDGGKSESSAEPRPCAEDVRAEEGPSADASMEVEQPRPDAESPQPSREQQDGPDEAEEARQDHDGTGARKKRRSEPSEGGAKRKSGGKGEPAAGEEDEAEGPVAGQPDAGLMRWRQGLMANFSAASDQDQEELPYICAAFEAWAKEQTLGTVTSLRRCSDEASKISEKTANSYAKCVVALFFLDGKAPSEMATQAYHEAVKRTIEDKLCCHMHSASITYFANFWKERGSRPFAGAEDVQDNLLKYYKGYVAKDRKPKNWAGQTDTSEEARKEDDLPDGWGVHTRSNGRVLGWSSPGKNFYGNKRELMVRLGRVSTPTRPKGGDPSASAPGETPEPDPDAPAGGKRKLVVPARPLDELLVEPDETQKATKMDRELLPRALATFGRWLLENRERRQTTRDTLVVLVFKLFSKANRSLAAIAEPAFADLVAGSEDSKRAHGTLGSAIRCFGAFWREVGGYEGRFDQASREHLNLALQVRPSLVDAPGECGQGGIGGEVCRRRRQRCETCNSVLRCNRHSEHSVAECREVFWATHSASGVRSRTMKDFMQSAASRPAAPAGAGSGGGGCACGAGGQKAVEEIL